MGSLLYIIGLACAIWVIYDVWAVNKRLSDTDKVIWTILAVFFSIITAIIYYLIKKRRTIELF
jgi:predicted outer membrane lipoprotein